MEKKDLKPALVFHYFEEVCGVPRPSKKEGKIRAYLLDFAEKNGLPAKSDEAGNVLITKPATPGKEKLKTVILQSHMDMVCEKNKDTRHDFDTDPIETYIDGEWLRAKGTTLGADNGIGIATELAILASDEIEHGPIQCLFTVDEETGLTGAFALKEGFMDGDILINLDSEDEGELFIGCAGGAGTTAVFPCTMTAAPEGYLRKYDLRLCEIDGGNLHNAIPREAHAVCAVPMAYKEAVRVDLNVYLSEVESEYAVTEPDLQMDLESESPCAEVMDVEQMRRFLLSIYAVHNGVYAMSQDIEGLVETSSNLASIKQGEGCIKVVTSQRSSLASIKQGEGCIKVVTSQRSSILSSRVDMSQMVSAAFELGGAKVETGDGYPGWKPNRVCLE